MCLFPVENVTKFNKLKKKDDNLRGFCVRSPNLRNDKKTKYALKFCSQTTATPYTINSFKMLTLLVIKIMSSFEIWLQC